jgi:ABC-2 type transport system permease protein
MINYMKYEIKGTYKFISAILALVLIIITGIYIYTSRSNDGSAVGAIFIVLSIFVLFGTALATFLFIVDSFRKDLYEDRGYLTFTVPLTGNQIVGSKLLVAFMWFTLIGVVIAIYNLIMVLSFGLMDKNITELFSAFFQTFSITEIFFSVISTIFVGLSILILIYFSMVLSRVSFRNKRIGGLWFIIFLVLCVILTYGEVVIADWLPYYLNLNTFHVEWMDMSSGQFNMEMNNDGVSVNSSLGLLSINIATTIYNIITFIALFLGTGYLIERKIDL